jgi:hypothetical protein
MIKSIFGEKPEFNEELDERDGKRFKNLMEIMIGIAGDQDEEIELYDEWCSIGFGGGGIELSTNFFEDMYDEETGEEIESDEMGPAGDVFMHFDQFGNFTEMEKDYA